MLYTRPYRHCCVVDGFVAMLLLLGFRNTDPIRHPFLMHADTTPYACIHLALFDDILVVIAFPLVLTTHAFGNFNVITSINDEVDKYRSRVAMNTKQDIPATRRVQSG
jgi:hypothetical protein